MFFRGFKGRVFRVVVCPLCPFMCQASALGPCISCLRMWVSLAGPCILSTASQGQESTAILKHSRVHP